jgi:SAM-dependent methyltransferase
MTDHHPSRHELLCQLAPGNLLQPATVLWRIFEIEAVQRHIAFAGRILDLGCGDGSLTRVTLGSQPGRCLLVGLEADPTDARDAERSGIYRVVHQVTAASIPEEDNAFDMVFSNSVLEHIVDLQPVLAEVARILKPDGTLVITVPSDQFHACLVEGTLLGALARWRGETAAARIDRRLRHYRYWSIDDWRNALSAVGLDVQAAHRYFPVLAVRSWQRISEVTGGLAFELFRRRSETRALQRRLKLDLIDRVVPSVARRLLLQSVLRSSLAFPADISGELSGGLLVVARKSKC